MKKSVLYFLCLMLSLALAICAPGCSGGSPSSQAPAPAPDTSPAASGDAAPAAGTAGGDKAPIIIGMVAPLTGANAQAGADMKNGAEMAIREINDAGGVEGHMLQLMAEDDQSVPAESVSAMEKLVGSGIVGVIGAFNSSCTIANMEVAKREGVPQITISAADSITTESDNPYMFRNSPYTSMFSEKMVEYVAENLPEIKTMVILGENTDYGLGIIEGTKALATAKGIDVVDVQTYNPRDTDFYSQLTKVKEMNPDGILMAGDRTEGAQIIRQGGELGLGDKQWFGFLSMSTTDFHTLAGGAEDGLIFVSCFEPVASNPASVAFAEKVIAETGTSPTMHYAMSYDAVYLFAETMKGYNEDLAAYRRAVRDNLAAIKDFDSIFGTYSFDEQGQADVQAFVGRWSNGEKTVLYPVS